MFEDKLKEVKKHFTGISDKVREVKERPKALEALNTVANYSEFFANGMKNLTGEDMPFTQVEFDTLSKMLTETKVYCACVYCNC
jgi:hypoxia up-regulated 1